MSLSNAQQHDLLTEALTCNVMFVPRKDIVSLNAFQSDMINYFEYPAGNAFPTQGLPILNQIIAFFLLPIFLIRWFYQRKYFKAGWRVNFLEKTIQSINKAQKIDTISTSDLGILVYEQKVEITHPAEGPLFVLYESASVGNLHDLEALNEFANTLAKRLNMRIVGQRATLMSLRVRLSFLVFEIVIGAVVVVGFLGAVKFSVN